MDELESTSCKCDVVKVEIVNGETLESKIREKMILLMLGSLGTLLLEQGTPFVVRKIIAYRKRKMIEAQAEQPKPE